MLREIYNTVFGLVCVILSESYISFQKILYCILFTNVYRFFHLRPLVCIDGDAILQNEK